jgi:hypothetical protein
MMTFEFRTLTAAAVALAGLALATTDASAQSQRVKNACNSDYNQFCPAYPIGSAQLRQCMRANGKKLSRHCLEALVDAGEIERSALKKR